MSTYTDQIQANVVCDSIAPDNSRLCSIQITAHRFVLAEINTHRALSRNYRSSRAVPVRKLLQEVRTQPAMPVYWGANEAGMQAGKELVGADRQLAKRTWEAAAEMAVNQAEMLSNYGLHKQIANRVLEPFLMVHGIISATEWKNFFGLRLHKDAQPEMRVLAEKMWAVFDSSVPTSLGWGEWHLPYISSKEKDASLGAVKLAKMSAARCARVSYKTFEETNPTEEEDLTLYNRLVGAQPYHASPLEHQAFCPNEMFPSDAPSNFGGCWVQFRKTLRGEAIAPLPQGYSMRYHESICKDVD